MPRTKAQVVGDAKALQRECGSDKIVSHGFDDRMNSRLFGGRDGGVFHLANPEIEALYENGRADGCAFLKLRQIGWVFDWEIHGHGAHPVADGFVLDGGDRDFSLRVEALDLALQFVPPEGFVLDYRRGSATRQQ